MITGAIKGGNVNITEALFSEYPEYFGYSKDNDRILNNMPQLINPLSNGNGILGNIVSIIKEFSRATEIPLTNTYLVLAAEHGHMSLVKFLTRIAGSKLYVFHLQAATVAALKHNHVDIADFLMKTYESFTNVKYVIEIHLLKEILTTAAEFTIDYIIGNNRLTAYDYQHFFSSNLVSTNKALIAAHKYVVNKYSMPSRTR